MPQHNQPLSLLELSHRQVSNNLVSVCQLLQLVAQDSSANHALVLAKKEVRPQYLYTLPGIIRSQLIGKVSKILSRSDGATVGAGPAPLYLLAILLAPDVRYLKIELCCYYGCSHQAALLKILSTDGKGLETLELSRSALLRLDRSLLQDVLTSASSLTHLMLKNIAADALLQIIGVSCQNLIFLDVSQSRQVTDAGLRYLFLQVELRDKDTASSRFVEVADPREVPVASTTSGNSNVRGWGRLKVLLKQFPWLRANRDCEKVKNKTILLEYCEHRNPLCDNLKVLNIANTGVTSKGVLLALNHVPELESLGEYSQVGHALEILDKARSASTSSEETLPPSHYRLTTARSQKTTVRHLQLLSTACPNLTKLYIFEPYHMPASLMLLKSALTILHLMNISLSRLWMIGLYEYLGSHGQNLQDLALRFYPGDENVIFHLSKIINSCPKLQTFYHEGADVVWEENESDEIRNDFEEKILPDLIKFQIGRAVTAKAFMEILRRTPKLRIAHFYSCPDITDEHIMNLTTNSSSEHCGVINTRATLPPNLECFYIYEASRVTNPAVVNLLAYCDNLISIGNFSNWGIDCEEIMAIHNTAKNNNINLQIVSGSHWYCSKCFLTL